MYKVLVMFFVYNLKRKRNGHKEAKVVSDGLEGRYIINLTNSEMSSKNVIFVFKIGNILTFHYLFQK